MIYGWIIGGLAALDLGVKSVVEGQEDDTFPRDLPSAKGFIKLHKNHNSGFPFGFMKERPELVKGIPLMVISAMAGALAAMMQDKGKTGEKLGLSLVMGGALSNLYDRVVRGYVVDYFTIEWKSLKKVVFNLGDMFVFLGSAVFVPGTDRGLFVFWKCCLCAGAGWEDAGVKKKKNFDVLRNKIHRARPVQGNSGDDILEALRFYKKK